MIIVYYMNGGKRELRKMIWLFWKDLEKNIWVSVIFIYDKNFKILGIKKNVLIYKEIDLYKNNL